MAHDVGANDLEDRRLIEAGDHGRLLAKYLPFIRRRVGMYLRGLDAEDVASEVVLHLYRELAGGKRYTAPFRTVVWRRAGWMAVEFIDGRPPGPFEHDPERDTGFEPPEPDDWGSIRQTLVQLPPRDAEVFKLATFGGLKPKEIAEHLDMDPNAVHQSMFRARRLLRTLIDG